MDEGFGRTGQGSYGGRSSSLRISKVSVSAGILALNILRVPMCVASGFRSTSTSCLVLS